VGKSTLINHWCGTVAENTQPVRESDQKGRHTTTQRHLIRLPDGGLIIDTPGLRELQLWEGGAGIDSAFDDVEDLAACCRFTNCLHESEPGCVVREALEDGRLDPGRFESHQKLKRELRHFENKHDKRAQAEEKRRVRASTRYLRDVNKKRSS
jgi:ribosome biogenesis GTPase